MPRRYIRRLLPNHEQIRSHQHLRLFGQLLHDPNLWHFNRRSVAGAFSVGLFFAFVPLPFQMVYAAAAAILLRVNLPISVALVWLTNPLTIPPMFYAAYKLGTVLLGARATHFEFQLSVHWLMSELGDIWAPLLLGCFIVGVASAALGNFLIRMLWRYIVLRDWRARRARRKARGPTKSP